MSDDAQKAGSRRSLLACDGLQTGSPVRLPSVCGRLYIQKHETTPRPVRPRSDPSRSTVDRQNFDDGVLVTEALATVGHVLAALVLADGDLVTERVLQHFDDGLGASDERRTDLHRSAISNEQHGQLKGGTDFEGFGAIEGELITLRGTVLTVTILDDGVHAELASVFDGLFFGF